MKHYSLAPKNRERVRRIAPQDDPRFKSSLLHTIPFHCVRSISVDRIIRRGEAVAFVKERRFYDYDLQQLRYFFARLGALSSVGKICRRPAVFLHGEIEFPPFYQIPFYNGDWVKNETKAFRVVSTSITHQFAKPTSLRYVVQDRSTAKHYFMTKSQLESIKGGNN